ncbi:MAG TPA: 50S ribosomal protein L11 methyltransferase [Chitinophagaceae bacterium]|nr:50S ribosomal protein L11 methyltransferase [Chitinophagaceae bacterium]
MNYIQITIKATQEQQEILISKLSLYAATGFEQNEENVIAYFVENNFDSYDINNLLKGYTYDINTIKEKNWNEVWESNFQPVIINDFCAIRADFHPTINNVMHEIIITPKMSFGTGHHATTHMMIEQMSELNFKNKTVFDFGTGTGILAILAEKLDAASITAIDNDEWSIENTKENSIRNNCSKINVALSETIPVITYDIILANINKNVILQNIEAIKKSCKMETYVLLSGLLTEDESEVGNLFEQNNFVFVNKKEKSNWISILFSFNTQI